MGGVGVLETETEMYSTPKLNKFLPGQEVELVIADVYLLCVTCYQPIRAQVRTTQWIKVEWISGEGECQACAPGSRTT